MIVFQVSLNFDPVIRNAENTISHMDMLKNIDRIVNIQKMPNLIYMQQLQISGTNFNKILQKN